MKLFWVFKHRNSHAHGRFVPVTPLRAGGLRLTVWITFFTLLIFVIWSHWANLDQITRAPGAVIASSKTQIIQSQEGGTIADLLVKEGDRVEADQVLLKFDRTRFETSFLEARAKAAGLAATVARLQAEVLGTDLKFPPELNQYPEFKTSQTMLFNKRQAAIREDIVALNELIDLVQKELAMTQPLLKTGDVSQTDILRLQRQVAELKSQVTNKRNKYFQDAQAELGKAQEDLAGVQQN